jgi:hypothetical protein
MRKKKIILFLGAGASAPFGKPTITQLKERLKPPDAEIRRNFRNLILTCPHYTDFEYIYYNALRIREFLQSSSGEFFKYLSETQNALHTYREPGHILYELVELYLRVALAVSYYITHRLFSKTVHIFK